MTRADYGGGSVTARKSKRTGRTTYQAQYSFDGARWSRTFRTRALATAWLRQQRQEREAGTLGAPTRLTVGELLDGYLQGKPPTLAYASLRHYRHLAGLLGPLHHLQAQSLKPEAIDLTLRDLRTGGTAASTVVSVRALLSAAYRWAIKKRRLSRNPVEAADSVPQEPTEAPTWTAQEAEQFLVATVETELGGLWRTFLLTGLRSGEVRGLRWCDVDLEGGWLQIRGQIADSAAGQQYKPLTKGKKARLCPLAPSLVQVLRAERDRQMLSRRYRPDGWVWQTGSGEFLTDDWVRLQWHAAVASVGLPRIKLHACRHAFGSIMRSLGADLKLVQTLLGHASIAVTANTYLDVPKADLQAAAALLDRAVGGQNSA